MATHRILISLAIGCLGLIGTGGVQVAAQTTYPVGTADVIYLDPDRDGRPVPADLYYPAQSPGADQPVADPPAGGFASVVFGHGYQMSAGVYAWVAQRLAAIGCVVAVPRTGGELFPDHEEFGLDLAFVSRVLRVAGTDASSPFFERMGAQTLVMGHSMGGGSSFLAAAEDPDVTAVANFAAAETNPSAVTACAQLDQPVLMVAAGNDCVAPPADHQVPMYDALTSGWRTLVTITGASHCQFNAYNFICSLGEFCNADISRQDQQDLTWLLLEPWVRAVLFGDYAAAQDFQSILAAGVGFTYSQAGQTSTAPETVPTGLRLEAAPNPGNPHIHISFDLPRSAAVHLAIFDLAGRHVRTLLDGRVFAAGPGHVDWRGDDETSRSVAAGVYVCRLSAAGDQVTRRLTLVR